MKRSRMSKPTKVHKAYLKNTIISNKNLEKNSKRLIDNLKARIYRRELIFMVDQMIGGKTLY